MLEVLLAPHLMQLRRPVVGAMLPDAHAVQGYAPLYPCMTTGSGGNDDRKSRSNGRSATCQIQKSRLSGFAGWAALELGFAELKFGCVHTSVNAMPVPLVNRQASQHDSCRQSCERAAYHINRIVCSVPCMCLSGTALPACWSPAADLAGTLRQKKHGSIKTLSSSQSPNVQRLGRRGSVMSDEHQRNCGTDACLQADRMG